MHATSRFAPLVAALILATVFTGCSRAPAGEMLPGAAAAPAAGAGHRAGSARASIVIHVPRRKRTRSKFVSPSTQSVAISIDPSAGCSACTPATTLYAGLSQSSPNCTTAATGLTCAIGLVLNPGSYLASVSTYDGPIAQNFPSGALLSLNSGITIAVEAGKANVPSITLDGVPAGIVFFNLGQKLVFLGSTPSTFMMVGPSSRAFFQAYATDADNNVILGPGSPSFTISPKAGFTGTVTGNTVELVAPAAMTAGFSAFKIDAVSPACAQSSAVCSWIESLGFDPIAAMADPGTNTVRMIEDGTNLAYATIATGIGDPVDVKYDKKGDLFVANQTLDTVSAYAPPYTGAPYATITNGINKPSSLAFSPDGKYLAVVNKGNGFTTIYSGPSFGGAPVTVMLPSAAAAFDPQDNLWVATPVSGFGAIRFPPPFTNEDTVVSDGIFAPAALTVDALGNLFVANASAGTVTEYAPTNYTLVAGSVTTPAGATSLADMKFGGFLACYSGGAQIYSSTMMLVKTFQAPATACRAAIGQDFSLWITFATDKLAEAYQYPAWAPIQQFDFASQSSPGSIDVFPPL
jgi:hypothetical protein